MSHSQIESRSDHRTAVIVVCVGSEVVPHAKGDGGKQKTAASASPVLHPVVSVGGERHQQCPLTIRREEMMLCNLGESSRFGNPGVQDLNDGEVRDPRNS